MILLFHIMAMPYLNAAPKIPKPQDNGLLKISQDGRFIQFANGKPFFWLGDTGWLLPELLQRDEAAYYLRRCGEAGYNVVQIQVVNGVPAYNAYGKLSMPKGFDFSTIDTEEGYGYWQHMDYIVDMAAANGIHVGMIADTDSAWTNPNRNNVASCIGNPRRHLTLHPSENPKICTKSD